MTTKRLLTLAPLMVLALAVSGCWWLDDENLHREKLIVINYTNYTVRIYVDGEPEMSVGPLDTEEERFYWWEDDDHTFFGETPDGSLTWGPTERDVDRGDRVLIRIYEDYWTVDID